MSEQIEFPTYDGRFTLRGSVYRPSDAGSPVAAVVMSGGFADSVERMVPTAEAFVRAGLGVLVYEHRNTGISEGEPRLEIDPVAQVRDMGMAITFAQTVAGFDAHRIGLFGTSFSGGHVLAVAAEDRRVKAVVASIPGSRVMTSGLQRVDRVCSRSSARCSWRNNAGRSQAKRQAS